VLGRRIHSAVLAARPVCRDVVEIGLANEYIYYLTTPEEYEVQDYEERPIFMGPPRASLTQYLASFADSLDYPARKKPGKKYIIRGQRTTFWREDFLEAIKRCCLDFPMMDLMNSSFTPATGPSKDDSRASLGDYRRSVCLMTCLLRVTNQQSPL